MIVGTLLMSSSSRATRQWCKSMPMRYLWVGIGPSTALSGVCGSRPPYHHLRAIPTAVYRHVATKDESVGRCGVLIYVETLSNKHH